MTTTANVGRRQNSRELGTLKIPKKDGKFRQLGVPTVADRIAQTVVRNRFESKRPINVRR